MSRSIATVVLALVVTLLGAAPAQASPLDSCRIWHGEDYCRAQVTRVHIPTRATVGPAPRDCHTSWADRRKDCGSQA